jgi:methylated-DNA-[protein]-cysteine S-methyltransferase
VSVRANAFTVESAVTRLAVTVNDGAVTRIVLGERGQREPKGGLERQVARELRQYLAGRRKEFTFPIATEGTEFQQRVWHALEGIPYGETVTYGELARRLGRSKAFRAVGTANGRNPIPIVIPCHRVVASGGRLGGYGGGLELKRKLLELESRNTNPMRQEML